MTDLVRQISAFSRHDTPTAGGKGAPLGELHHAGFVVPAGFIVTTHAFRNFMRVTGTIDALAALLPEHGDIPNSAIDALAQHIQARFLEKDLPDMTASAIKSAFRQLGASHVAVRSSATTEDGKKAAWAGQLKTFLNTTEPQLIQNIMTCWASLFAPQAISYWARIGARWQDLAIAVIVQQMVESEFAGVAFSVHPESEDQREMLIEAGIGLGEAVVTGAITPDAYLIQRETLAITNREPSKQTRALVGLQEGGIHWTELSPAATKQQKLGDHEIIELASLVMRIEQHFGYPVDVEWARSQGTFYILQARPITTLTDRPFPNAFRRDVSWALHLIRPFSLFGASLWHAWYESPHMKKLLGVHFKEALIIEERPGLVRSYKEKSTLQAMRDAVRNLIQTEPGRLRDAFERGVRLNQQAEKVLSMPPEEFGGLDQAVEFLIDVALHATVLPNVALAYLNESSLENADLIATAEALRATSFYPRLIGELVLPLAAGQLDKLGVADPTRAAEMLTLAEILSGSVHEIDIRRDLRARGMKYVYQRTNANETISWLPDVSHLVLELEGLDPKALQGVRQIEGTRAFKGLARGTARVVLSDDGKSNQFEDGDVIVTVNANPNLIRLLLRCSAIVTDEGGASCHAAILSRELKKPCVIGTRIATTIIQDGNGLEVDANRGIVTVLQSAKTDPVAVQ